MHQRRWIGRHPEVARWLDGWKAAELVDRPPLVPIHAPIVTLDHPVDRYVAWLTRQVIDRLVDVADELDRIAGKIDEPLWCRARAERARTAALRLRRLRDRSWLTGLRPEPASEAAFLVVADDPTYARYQRIAQVREPHDHPPHDHRQAKASARQRRFMKNRRLDEPSCPRLCMLRSCLT